MKLVYRPLILILVALTGANLASADVVSPPKKGMTFVTHKIQITNLEKHPGYSLLVYDAPGKLRASLVFNAGTVAAKILVSGRSWRSRARFGRPKIWLLPRALEKKWSAATDKEIARQRKACADHGKGCAHISRFSPRYAPPKGAVDCGVTVTVRSSVPTREANKARQVVDVYRIVKAGPKVCKLARVKRR